jgi:hypothetical protein
MRSVTYLIYTVFWESLIFGGCGYFVVATGASGWWFLLALLISGAQFSPERWNALFNRTTPATKPE